MSVPKHPTSHGKQHPPGSLLGKLKKRGIIGALAAIIGSGWLIYEIVHFILVEHYHLSEKLKDIVIVSTVCLLLSNLTWRWFRGGRAKRRLKWEFVLIPIIIATGAYLNALYLFRSGESATDPDGSILKEAVWKNSVAILPFVNMSADKEQDYFCDGLTEELITRLSQIRELKVAARTSAFVFKGESADIREVGQKLRVENVLEGSVRKSGSRIRITAQLISAADGYHLWSEAYDRDMKDIFAVQEEISRSVAETLEVRLLGKDGAVAETGSSDAYTAFLMGNTFYGRQSREFLEKAVIYYEQAVTLDPGFARAWSGLGATYAFQAGAGYVPPNAGYGKAKAAIKKALALDKDLAYAHRVRGWIQMSCDWDWKAAEASYRKAMVLDPGKGEVETAQLFIAQGRFEAAEALARHAVEVDPISIQPYATLALAYWYGGQLEKAEATYRKILEFAPEYPAIQGLIALVHITRSETLEAQAELEKVEDPFWRLPGIAMVRHSQGRRAESDAALAEFIEKYQEGGAYNIAQAYAFRREPDEAFRWLEKAYVQHDGGMFLMMVDPFLENLRNDGRFRALLKRLRLSSPDSTPGSEPPIN